MKTALDLAQMDPALFLSPAQIATFLLAGHVKMGLANTATGNRQTYSVEVAKATTARGGKSAAHGVGPWFVKVHTGNDEWAFLGTIHRWTRPSDGEPIYQYKPSPRAAFSPQSQEQRGIIFLARFLSEPDLTLPAVLRVWREAACARCGEALFSDYVALGFGPVCAKKMGLTPPKATKAKPDAKIIPFPAVA